MRLWIADVHHPPKHKLHSFSSKQQHYILPEVTDPFGGDAGDFDWANYDINVHMSNQSYATAVDNLPECIQQWKGTPE